MKQVIRVASLAAAAVIILGAGDALWLYQGGSSMLAMRPSDVDPEVTRLVDIETLAQGIFSYHVSMYEDGVLVGSGVRFVGLAKTVGASIAAVAIAALCMFLPWRNARVRSAAA